MDIFIVVLLMVIAIGLIILEVFFLPGTTIGGIAGACFAIAGIVFAYVQLGSFWGNIILVSSIVIFGAIFVWFIKSNALNKVALNEEIDSKIETVDQEKIKPGDEGITLSRVNPIGKARINGETVEAKSTGEFIDQEMPIVVIKVFPNNVLIEEKKNN